MRWSSLVIFFLFWACTPKLVVQSTTEDVNAEERLVMAIDTFRANAYSRDYMRRYRGVRDSLKNEFVEALSSEIPITQDLPRLAEKVRICTSSDAQIRFFSWDERSGGTMHDMAVIAQFVGEEGEVLTQVMDERSGAEISNQNTPPDIVFGEIHRLPTTPARYLCLGWGTYGSGHHHEAARVLEIQVDQLVDCQDCFAGDRYLTVVAARVDSIGLRFDPASLQLTHQLFERDEEIGFMRATGEQVVWRLSEGRFVRED